LLQAEGALTSNEGFRRWKERKSQHDEDSNNLAPLATVEYARVPLMSGAGDTLWPAAIEAAEMIEPGMVVGLGTGRAAAMFLRALARRIQEGLRARGVPTSKRTGELANELGVPLVGLDEIEIIDIDVDGADEVDPSLDLIKGHGGALLRERVVASVSKELVILAGEEKIVPRLGARMSVPVEVVPFAAPVARRKIEALGADVRLRMSDGRPFVSDNGNQILDAKFESIEHAADLERRINALPGVVDNGLFIGMADLVLVQSESGFRRLSRS
jgi:ribose 5-phosphate isomerase A